jgi:hypothetical protein
VWCWLLIRTRLFAPLQGHLFDTGLINQVLDLLEASSKEVPFTVSNCDVRPNNSSGAQYSRVALELTSEGMCVLVPCAGFCGRGYCGVVGFCKVLRLLEDFFRWSQLCHGIRQTSHYLRCVC